MNQVEAVGLSVTSVKFILPIEILIQVNVVCTGANVHDNGKINMVYLHVFTYICMPTDHVLRL